MYPWSSFVKLKLGQDAGDLGPLKYVIASLPRSGTAFIYSTLKQLLKPQGRYAGHERVFTPGGVDLTKTAIDVDVSGFVAPYLPLEIPVFHVVRHPVEWANSVLNFFPGWFLEEKPTEKDWFDVLNVWVMWHDVCRRNAVATVQVEDGKTLWDNIRVFLKLPRVDGILEEAIGQARRNGGPRTKVYGTWTDLPDGVRQAAECYGYRRKVDA